MSSTVPAAGSATARKVTMADVAKLAEVSTATVSNFLSGRNDLLRRVSPEVQQRIADAVLTMGYVQNATARHLRLQRTNRICVLLPRLGIPYADKIASDVDAVARSRGYATVIVTGDTIDVWRRVVREVEAGLADGLVCDADGFTVAEVEEVFGGGRRKPALVLHATARPTGYSVVNHNRLAALGEALQHVIQCGRRRLAYLENDSGAVNPRRRLIEDFIAANRDGLELVTARSGAGTRSAAVQAVHELRIRERGIDCVLVESDFSAVTVVEELQRQGYSVPGDVAVIGCGNAEEGYYAYPRLTTIGPHVISLAEATNHLVERIDAPERVEPRSFFLPWSLILRESA